jgi:hypothetical protein
MSVESHPSHEVDHDSLVILVDRVPSSIALYTFIAFAVSAVGAYWASTAIFSWGFCSPLGVFIGVIVGAGTAYISEYMLKRYWVSDRFVHLTPKRLSFIFGKKEDRFVDPTERINVLAWYFEVKRNSRVPKGWYVLALCFEQDDIYLPIYALLSPDDFQNVDTNFFKALTGSRRDYKADENVRVAAEQKRLLTAETARNIDGVEATFEDVEKMLTYLQEQFPEWMPRLT